MTRLHLLSVGRWALILYVALRNSGTASAQECDPPPALGNTYTTELPMTMPANRPEAEVFLSYEVGRVFMMKGGGGYQPLVITSVEASDTTVCYRAAEKSFAVLLRRGQRSRIKLRGYCLNQRALDVPLTGNRFQNWILSYEILDKLKGSTGTERQQALWKEIADKTAKFIPTQ